MLYEFLIIMTVLTADNHEIRESEHFNIRANSLTEAQGICNDYADMTVFDTQDSVKYRIVKAECIPSVGKNHEPRK